MKVKDLIEALEKLDKEGEVGLYAGNDVYFLDFHLVDESHEEEGVALVATIFAQDDFMDCDFDPALVLV